MTFNLWKNKINSTFGIKVALKVSKCGLRSSPTPFAMLYISLKLPLKKLLHPELVRRWLEAYSNT